MLGRKYNNVKDDDDGYKGSQNGKGTALGDVVRSVVGKKS